jgi:SAM-dependent methyltransferase
LDYAIRGLSIGQQHGIQGVVGELNIQWVLPFQTAIFDVVVCKDILEHLIDPISILREVGRVLKDDGYVAVSIPNHFYFPFRLRILLGGNLLWKTIGSDHRLLYSEWDYMHIRYFTFRGFRQFIREAGFEPEQWFWDIGTLAHYHNPDMYLEPQIWKMSQGIPLSRRGKIGLMILRPAWKVFNVLFPKVVRRAIVSLFPGLLCAGFYARLRKVSA